jgi:hypothetical protein
MVMEIVEGKKYWSCKQVMETESYGDESPHRPWQGIIKVRQNPGGTVYYLHHFDENDQIDDDSNATTIVRAQDIFENEYEACEHYAQLCHKSSIHHGEQQQYYLEEFFKYNRKALEQKFEAWWEENKTNLTHAKAKEAARLAWETLTGRG